MTTEEYLKELAEKHDLKKLEEKLKETIQYVKTHSWEDIENE